MSNKSHVLKEYDEQSSIYEKFAFKVNQLLEEMLKSENISYNAATYRLKAKDSLSKKIDRKQDKYKCLGDLTDIAGVRIITFYSDDVDKVVELVEKEFEVDRDNSIDKRKSLEPDRFGYCSVHYVVGMNSDRLKLREYQPYNGLKCEIQIRTVLQHAWAEIEHDLGYKSEKTIPQDIRRNFSRLAGLLEIGDKEFLEIREFLSSYAEKVAEKIDDCVLDDRELDAVILKEFIKTDKDIIRISSELKAISGSEYFEAFIDNDCQEEINRLLALNIKSLGQLKQMIVRNETAALKIAQILLDDGDRSSYIPMTIAIFYLCYAELLTKYHDYSSIQSHLADAFRIYEEEFIQYLLNIQKSLGL